MINFEIEPFSEYDYESIILNFWMHSVSMRMKEFDFETAFESIKEPIERKLNEHGLMDFEGFRDNEEEMFCFDDLNQFTSSTNYCTIDVEDIKEAVLRCRYDKLKETFEDYEAFQTLKNLLVRIENARYTDLEKKIILFDEIIHAQHETGDIFEDVDIDNLRETAEEEIKKTMQTV